MYDLKTKLSIG